MVSKSSSSRDLDQPIKAEIRKAPDEDEDEGDPVTVSVAERLSGPPSTQGTGAASR